MIHVTFGTGACGYTLAIGARTRGVISDVGTYSTRCCSGLSPTRIKNFWRDATFDDGLQLMEFAVSVFATTAGGSDTTEGRCIAGFRSSPKSVTAQAALKRGVA